MSAEGVGLGIEVDMEGMTRSFRLVSSSGGAQSRASGGGGNAATQTQITRKFSLWLCILPSLCSGRYLESFICGCLRVKDFTKLPKLDKPFIPILVCVDILKKRVH